jgi:hypothetical protein
MERQKYDRQNPLHWLRSQAFPLSPDTLPARNRRREITIKSVQPVSWNEASILERRFVPGIDPEEAVAAAADLIHDDYAYIYEAFWDLWMPNQLNGKSGAENYEDKTNEWLLVPSLVKFIVQGEEFDNAAQQQTGHIEIDFGLDSPFLQEDVELNDETQTKVRANVAKLVEFTVKAEKNTRASGRLLWSESEENLAQKLIARLQKVQ